MKNHSLGSALFDRFQELFNLCPQGLIYILSFLGLVLITWFINSKTRATPFSVSMIRLHSDALFFLLIENRYIYQ